MPGGQREQHAFDCIKALLANITELNIPVVGQPFQLFTDASGVAVGSCLAQTDEHGVGHPVAYCCQTDEQAVDHPVAYSSQKLTDVQTRWSTIDRESYAIIVALLKWHDIIFGSHITV